MRILVLTAAIVSIALAGCGPTPPGAGPVVLASTSFLADIAQNVAGDRLMIPSLLPVGMDPHTYQPVPADLVTIEQSMLIIVNGLEYEHFLEPMLENVDGERLILTASDGLKPHLLEDGQAANDPHLWLDPNLVITYVENIRAGLTKIDPQGTDIYQTNADAYAAQLKDLDAWISDQVAQIPPGRMILVTNHEALGYFADRYGFQIAGTLLTNVSSAASPSARELSRVIDEIKATGAPAIFLDEVENPNFAQQISEETGVIVVDDLHLESLTEGPPAGTYIDMMKHNVSRIVGALK